MLIVILLVSSCRVYSPNSSDNSPSIESQPIQFETVEASDLVDEETDFIESDNVDEYNVELDEDEVLDFH